MNQQNRAFMRESCFSSLLFVIGGDETTSLQAWHRGVSETKQVIRIRLGEIVKDPLELFDGVFSLSSVYSLFHCLSILVSEEFYATLDYLVSNDRTAFTKKFGEINNEDIESECFHICTLLRQNWIEVFNGWSVPVVRQVSVEEILRCKNNLPRSLYIAIDPYTPAEFVANKVKQIVLDHHEIAQREVEQSWKSEVRQGVVSADFARKQAEAERLSFDFRRISKANTKRASGAMAFEEWLLRLRIFDLYRQGKPNGKTQKDIADKIFPKDPGGEKKISQNIREARAIISAVLAGFPIATVTNTRQRRTSGK